MKTYKNLKSEVFRKHSSLTKFICSVWNKKNEHYEEEEGPQY